MANHIENELAKARQVVDVAMELCVAVDNAGEDIGGSRPVKEILADLGPLCDDALWLRTLNVARLKEKSRV